MKVDGVVSVEKIAYDFIVNNVVLYFVFDFRKIWRFFFSKKKRKILMVSS